MMDKKLDKSLFEIYGKDQDTFAVFENEINNFRLETLAQKIKLQTYKPKQKIFYY